MEKLANRIDKNATFEPVAREFYAAKASGWSPNYGARWIDGLERDVFPWLGALPLPSITAPAASDLVQGRGQGCN